MTIEELSKAVILCDGTVASILIRHPTNTVEVTLIVRHQAPGHPKVSVALIFTGRVEHSFNDDNMDGTFGDYSDITFVRRADGRYYLSVDPYGNSGAPHENDNDIVVADNLEITLRS